MTAGRDRIVYFITRSDAIGGAAVHVKDLALCLTHSGIDACVLVGGQGMYVDELRSAGIHAEPVPALIRSLNPVMDVAAFLDVRRALKKLRPTLLSTHSSKAGIIGRIAARSLGVPSIFTAHGWSFTEGVPAGRALVYRKIERIVARAGNHIIAVSEFDRQLALASGITDKVGISRVHNGMPDIDVEWLARPALQPPRLVMVGRFEEQKNQEGLIDSLATLRDLEWRMEFIGDGPRLDDAKRKVAALGLEGRVTFHGYCSKPQAILAGAQLFVLTTHWEGLPRSIIEAMRAGLPVVATAVGGVPELVEEGVTGYLVPVVGGPALSAKLRTLLSDPALRARFGQAGRRRYEAEFSFARMFEQTVGVYEKVLGRPLRRVAHPTVV